MVSPITLAWEPLRASKCMVKVSEAPPGNCELCLASRKHQEVAHAVSEEKIFSCGMVNNGYSCVGSPENPKR